MGKATFSMLGDADKKLVLETEPKRLKALNEEALIDLQGRVIKARQSNVIDYQRESANSGPEGLSLSSSKKARRASARAEEFEVSLARVSKRIASVAKANAEKLRSDRLAAAKGAGSKAKVKKARLEEAKRDSKMSA